MDLNAATSLLASIRNLYPQARITSGYRSPNNPLSRANPHSPHMGGSPGDPTAVDIAPIPGVNFNDYVNSVRQAGVPISHAYDEAAHPFKWTTGPNWHLDTAGAPQQVAAAPRKPRTLASLQANPADIANGVSRGLTLASLASAPPTVSEPSPMLQSTPQQPMQGPAADLAASLPTVAQPKKSPFTLGNILGVIGDGLLGYAGMKPEFAPALQQQQSDERTQSFEREKFNAQLDAQRQIALLGRMYPEPDDYQKVLIGNGIRPGTPEWNAHMATHLKNMDDPVVMTPNGPMLRSMILSSGGMPAPSGVTFTPIS